MAGQFSARSVGRGEEDTRMMTSELGGEEVRMGRAEGKGRPGFRGDKSQVVQG